MKLPNIRNNLPVEGSNNLLPSSKSGFDSHPTRRLSDVTPASRWDDGPQYPPTSPKIHELKERFEPKAEADDDLPPSRRH